MRQIIIRRHETISGAFYGGSLLKSESVPVGQNEDDQYPGALCGCMTIHVFRTLPELPTISKNLAISCFRNISAILTLPIRLSSIWRPGRTPMRLKLHVWWGGEDRGAFKATSSKEKKNHPGNTKACWHIERLYWQAGELHQQTIYFTSLVADV